MKNTKTKVNWANIGICCSIVSTMMIALYYASQWIPDALETKWPWFTEIEVEEES